MLPIIDIIYVLKLKKNDKSELQEHLKLRFPDTPVLFYEVEGKTTNKNEGEIDSSIIKIMNHNTVDDIALDITGNHIEMIKDAIMNNYKNVLFMEEDGRLEEGNPKKMEHVNHWLTYCPKWDIFYLGYCHWPILLSFFITTSIVKLSSPLCTHAYILNRRGMEKVLNYTEYGKKNMNMHIDKIYSTLPNFFKYGIFPMISFQNKDPALFTKTFDKVNMKISMKTVFRILEYSSIILPIIIIVLFIYFLTRFFF
jgi:hypothetical protein